MIRPAALVLGRAALPHASRDAGRQAASSPAALVVGTCRTRHLARAATRRRPPCHKTVSILPATHALHQRPTYTLLQEYIDCKANLLAAELFISGVRNLEKFANTRIKISRVARKLV